MDRVTSLPNQKISQKTNREGLAKEEGGEGYIQTAGGEGKNELLSCNWEGLLKDLDYHLQNECILKGEKCKYWDLIGCRVMVNPKTKEKHEKEDVAMHFGLAMNELATAKQEITEVSLQLRDEFCALVPSPTSSFFHVPLFFSTKKGAK